MQEQESIWMKEDEDSYASYLKPARRLLDWGIDQPSLQKSNTFFPPTDYTPLIIFIVVSALMFVVFCLIVYCMRLANASHEAPSTPEITLHAPPFQRNSLHQSYSTIPRPLAPPKTSRSLILLPGEQLPHTLSLGLDNPNYNPPATNVSNKEGQNSNATPLLDLPPAYDTVVQQTDGILNQWPR